MQKKILIGVGGRLVPTRSVDWGLHHLQRRYLRHCRLQNSPTDVNLIEFNPLQS